jgi:hypothetical protein
MPHRSRGDFLCAAESKGSMTASEVERQAAYTMAKIREGKYPRKKAYRLLDNLKLWVMQEDPRGLQSPSLSAIDAEITEVMYPSL